MKKFDQRQMPVIEIPALTDDKGWCDFYNGEQNILAGSFNLQALNNRYKRNWRIIFWSAGTLGASTANLSSNAAVAFLDAPNIYASLPAFVLGMGASCMAVTAATVLAWPLLKRAMRRDDIESVLPHTSTLARFDYKPHVTHIPQDVRVAFTEVCKVCARIDRPRTTSEKIKTTVLKTAAIALTASALIAAPYVNKEIRESLHKKENAGAYEQKETPSCPTPQQQAKAPAYLIA